MAFFMTQIIKLSNLPLIYSAKIKEPEFIINLKNKLIELGEKEDDEEFIFSGSKEGNNLRKSINIKKLFDDELKIGKFVKVFGITIKNIINSYLNDCQIKVHEDIRLLARIRLFKDYPGYFLAPHNDSVDTITSIILPVYKKQELTAGYELIRKSKATIKTNNTIDIFNDFFQSIGKEYKIQSNEFKTESVVEIAISNDYKIVMILVEIYNDKNENIEKNYKVNIWRVRDYILEQEHVMAIMNPTCGYINDLTNNSKYISQMSRHGVIPTEKIRMNFIIDVLANKGTTPVNDRFGYVSNQDFVIEFGKTTRNKIINVNN